MGLTAKQVLHAKPGRHLDGKGLYLLVKPTGSKSWVLRVQADGRRRDFGLGPADLVSLEEARGKAIEGRKLMRVGRDPSIEWKRIQTAIPTFAEVARQFHQTNKSGWRNAKHSAQWLTSLETYAFPSIGKLLPDNIDAPKIWSLLGPIWQDKPETARRVRQRIGTILDYAKAHGWRTDEAPMRALAMIASKQPKRTGHFAAMPYVDLPAFMAGLREQEATVGRLALQFAVLTATRSGEVRGATWDEIDLDKALWSIPGERMKAGEPHVVPLSGAALAILRQAQGLVTGRKGEPVFPGFKAKPLSGMTLSKALRVAGGTGSTVHGMRSAFRDWVAEMMPTVPGDVAEAALAHTIANKTEAAYRRAKYLDQRRDLMERWAEYIAGASNVLQLAVSNA